MSLGVRCSTLSTSISRPGTQTAQPNETCPAAQYRRGAFSRAISRPFPEHERSVKRAGRRGRMWSRRPRGRQYGRMERQLEYVLRTVEERNVRFVRLWFTDVVG